MISGQGKRAMSGGISGAAGVGEQPPWTVTRLANAIKEKLQSDRGLQGIWIEGEISNYSFNTASGHIYFSLKDPESILLCTFFRYANMRFRHIRLENGMKILAKGNVTAYAQRSQFQLNVQEVTIAGAGELRLRVEQLKRKLHEEGLFDPRKKRALPRLPVTLGIATAPSGAAIQDIIHVARKRFPNINILLAPCLVQGVDAPLSVVSAIELLNDPIFNVDLIIAGRGGGSFEDLLAFNDERVVRAFVHSRVPIISAVGHEVDNVITDLAADASAPTPSAAAQMAVPVFAEVDAQVRDSARRLHSALRNRYRSDLERLRAVWRAKVFAAPRSMLETRAQRLDDIARSFWQAARDRVRLKSDSLRASERIHTDYKRLVAAFQEKFGLAAERLVNFSPLSTLKRGYAIVMKAGGAVVRDSSVVATGEKLEVLLDKGRLSVGVLGKEN